MAQQADKNGTSSAAVLEELSERLIGEHWEFYPTTGSRIGRHEYDGRLPDLSPSSIRRREREIRRGQNELNALDTSSLSSDQMLSWKILDLFLQRELFTFEEMRPLENNPMRQAGFLNVGNYVRRDYAPLEDRIRSATSALRQVPEFLQCLDIALRDDLSRHMVDMSVESYSGMAHFYRNDMAAFGRQVSDPDIANDFRSTIDVAASALDHFVERLKERSRAHDNSFAIGERLYSKMLSTGEGLDLPLSRVAEVGQANLEDNLLQIRELAASIDPSRSVQEIVDDNSRHHPTAEGLIPDTREMLEEIRQSLLDFDVISVPSEDRCQLVETPAYMRYAFAAMDSAGALETRATESFYYVTPVEDHWTPEQAEEWLSKFDYNTLRIISIHEVYPGHFVHNLHNRYGRGLPLVNRAATSYAFSEGWAHYTEQMMMETEYGQGRRELLLTQLLEALVRNCRYMCSIAMHTGGMTVDEATTFFVDNAYMGEHPARREALRGTFDPGYLNYTLGKLMILKLRMDCRQEQGSSYSLKGFHDKLLSHGAPQLPFLRSVMLSKQGTAL